ncbi:unnamed protein product [Aphanomyces euteiches]|uniref:Polycystin cation channel PKD1/PKD2 domain-containing protein n=1 Tax=Aphanomyces euteiches TaxID=100861 RepID=A0A6G0WG15_9STRA|nr:hypothetical protein Ae201684_015939 [Aphanomyces euteiches]KAH9088399.1 hypothetical protein Ae201684P_003092 [Aphanomyces euteiches]KAH9156492.1 hypothetical protein AeRB84_001613 [Aphanomyces euteiches]
MVRQDDGLDEPLMEKSAADESLLPPPKVSPWEKYWKQGRIPWKVLFHVLLMICVTLQIMLYGSQNSAYVRASYRNWAYFFLPNGATIAASLDAKFEELLFTVNDTIHAVEHVRDAYYSIKEVSVATYDYHYATATSIEPVLMTVTQYRNESILDAHTYNLTKTSLGPFDAINSTQAALAYLHTIVAMDFAFPLRDIDYGPFYFDCFDWTIQLKLEMQQNSHFRMSVGDCALAVCSVNNVWATLRGRFLWLNVVVVVFALAYFVLIGRSLGRTWLRIARAKQRHVWHDMPLHVKLGLINLHHLLLAVTLLLLIYNATWNISSVVVHIPLSFWHRFVQAIGPLLLWATFVGYLEHNQRFYSIVLTLRGSIPKVMSFLVGVSPIFFGYAIFGSIVFGYRVDRFGGIQQSCITLFAIMNGDVILETFASLSRDFPLLGAAYLYSFIALFIYVVLNIFIAIVEEAFFATRSHTRALDKLSYSLFPQVEPIEQ